MQHVARVLTKLHTNTGSRMISDQVKSIYQSIIDEVIEKSIPAAQQAGYSGSIAPHETLGRIKAAWIQNLQKELGWSLGLLT